MTLCMVSRRILRLNLIMQDYVQEAAMNGQSGIFVTGESELSESIHEMADTRPCRTDHRCRVILANPGNHKSCPAFLSKMGEQQENPSQAFLS